MPDRLRKFIGMILLVAFIVIYAIIVATIPIQNIPGWLLWPAYAAAGLLWVPPAGLIIRWMQKTRPPRA